MKVSLFDYALPSELIAQRPSARRAGSRLMVLDRSTGGIEHRQFSDIVEYLGCGDLLVRNDTRVMPARVYGLRRTLGRVEVLFLRHVEGRMWEALVGSGGKVRPGEKLRLADGAIEVKVAGKSDDGIFTLDVLTPDDLRPALEKHGHMPVPPYIRRDEADAELLKMDRQRYQTVYATSYGAAAAPTAGLHFTEQIFEELRTKGVEITDVTLHVGLGTFRPVKTENVEDHVMHREYYEVPAAAAAALDAARRDRRRVVAVGTTTTRVIESLPPGEVAAARSSTDLFIYPPCEFKRVGAMVTNFHLPRSTLLMMVSAFAGRERVLEAYAEAVRCGYRFYSYGDAMLIL